jgi:AP2-like factor, ANT lineage
MKDCTAVVEKGTIMSVTLYRSCSDWRRAEGKGPKLEDFMSVTCSNKSGSIHDSSSHADQVHDLHPLSGPYYYHGHGGGGGIDLEINVNAPPVGCQQPDHRVLAPQDHLHHHFLPHHHGQSYFLGTPANPGPSAATPVMQMYNAAAGVGSSMSISGIKSWLREAMYVPERSSALSLSVADVPGEQLPAPMPVARRPAQTFGQRTSQFRGVTRLVMHAN